MLLERRRFSKRRKILIKYSLRVAAIFWKESSKLLTIARLLRNTHDLPLPHLHRNSSFKQFLLFARKKFLNKDVWMRAERPQTIFGFSSIRMFSIMIGNILLTCIDCSDSLLAVHSSFQNRSYVGDEDSRRVTKYVLQSFLFLQLSYKKDNRIVLPNSGWGSKPGFHPGVGTSLFDQMGCATQQGVLLR